jgi:hypothetical protein
VLQTPRGGCEGAGDQMSGLQNRSYLEGCSHFFTLLTSSLTFCLSTEQTSYRPAPHSLHSAE